MRYGVVHKIRWPFGHRLSVGLLRPAAPFVGGGAKRGALCDAAGGSGRNELIAISRRIPECWIHHRGRRWATSPFTSYRDGVEYEPRREGSKPVPKIRESRQQL